MSSGRTHASIRVAEPTTIATDYLIAAACGYFALSLAASLAPVEWPLGFALGGMALLMLAAFTVMAASLALRGGAVPALSALACVCLNGAGVVVQMRKLAPHARFNHNDLFHVLQLAALWCLYAAVRTVG